MKTKNYLLLTAIFASAIMITLNGCKKDDESDLAQNARDEAEVTSLYDDVYNDVDETTSDAEEDGYSAPTTKSFSSDTTGTRTVSITQAGDSIFPKTITVEYNNWTSPRGRVKDGKIIIVVTARYISSEYTHTVTFNNFTIDGNAIEGQKVVARTSADTFNVVLTNGKVTFTDGTIYTRNFVRTRVMTAGASTLLYIWDDAYKISGVSNGINRQGKEYTHTIITPLEISLGCPWIKKGRINIEVEDATLAFIDYGDGDCDNTATATIDAKQYTITLKGNQ